MTRLIINADDFGLTRGINDAILALNRMNAVTSATLMATAPECDNAVAGALAQPSLRVGCHLVIVDGTPALEAGKIPTLVSRAKGFRSTLSAFVRDLHLGRIDDAEIEAEATAQIRRLQELGIPVSHVDTHKHTHMFPRVLRPLIRAAMACGVKAIRNPFEPQWSIKATPGASRLRKLQLRILDTQRGTFLRLIHQAGLKTTDGTIGILSTGSLDAATLPILIDEASGGRGEAPAGNRAMGTYELCCHPGYEDSQLDSLNTRLHHSRQVEIEALASTFTESRSGIQLINYGQLIA